MLSTEPPFLSETTSKLLLPFSYMLRMGPRHSFPSLKIAEKEGFGLTAGFVQGFFAGNQTIPGEPYHSEA